MKKNFLKYILLFLIILTLTIIYFSTVGIETEKFNNQIKNKIIQSNKNLNIDLKKIKLILDPINLNINAKTLGATIFYSNKPIPLEYIKTKVSLISFIKNKFISSNLQISTKSILLKDLVKFVRSNKNTPQLFFFEKIL